LLSKHLTGWINWTLLGRGRSFATADRILAGFRKRVAEYRPDLVVFSGDACAFGFPSEAHRAAELLGVGRVEGLAVPGNHDHYTRSAVSRRGFESAFEPWMTGSRLDAAEFPFVRTVNGVSFVGLNSSVSNRGVFDARGRVGPDQLDRLDRLMKSLPPGPRVLVTHYPYCTAEGVAEPKLHGLRDRAELGDLATRHGVSLWLCGHRHRSFTFGPTAGMPFQVVCAGSATHSEHQGWWEIERAGETWTIRRGKPGSPAVGR
jgi:3',5'-cyclic AMP phosphodiesterase CpdA